MGRSVIGQILGDCGLNPICQAGEALGGVAGSVAGSAIKDLADAVGDALGKVLASLGTLWVKIDTPNLTTSDGSTPSSTVAFIQDSLWWYMSAAAILAVMIGGARMAWERRAEPGRELVKALLLLTLVSGCGLAVISLAVVAADEFSEWIINRAVGTSDFGSNITKMLALTGPGAATFGPLLVILLGFIAILVSFIQIMLMVMRAGMLVVLAGVWPLSASFTNTEMGKTWFRRSTSWLVAFILYKPTAAIIYAVAFRLVGADLFGRDGLINVLAGVILMIVAIVALPALMKFVTPMVGAVAAGGGGGLAGAAAMVLPTGAMALSSGGGSLGMGGGGPSGSNGTAGASGAATAGGPGPGGPDGRSPTPSPVGNSGAAASSGASAGGAAASQAGAAAAGGPAGAAIAAAGAVSGAGRRAAESATDSAGDDGAEGSDGKR
jgi:type IV secretion system protein TrbL